MRLVLLGPPGAGKGTQAEVLSAEYEIPHISTGDILREAVREETEIGKEVNSFMERGELVPDNIVTEIVVNRVAKPDASRGFILDGYPRNKGQAESLDKALEGKKIRIDRVLYFKTSQSVIIKRLSGRRVCPKCNSIYHLKNNPPKKDEICDRCASKLLQRKDDKEDTVKKRLAVYKEAEEGLLGYYKTKNILKEVSGDLSAEKLFRSLKASFKKEGP
ncbi:MAG: adenylate kinase [Candidatus Omnitrophica bacterium]|nr:adenylate kinase [Candidatus Omnitrophota bacterium]